jgi:hypothetical protein
MKRYILVILANVFVVMCFAQQRTNTQRTATQRTNTQQVEATQALGAEGGITVTAIPDQTYTGQPYTPEVLVKDGTKTLAKNVDYALTYSNNVNVGKATVTISGKGNYADTKDVNFNIVPKSMNTILVNPIPEQTYRASAITPDVLIKDGNKTLIKDVDYTISFANNLNVGTANITVTGKGNYKDQKAMTFRIKAKSMTGNDRTGRPAPPTANSTATTQETKTETQPATTNTQPQRTTNQQTRRTTNQRTRR